MILLSELNGQEMEMLFKIASKENASPQLSGTLLLDINEMDIDELQSIFKHYVSRQDTPKNDIIKACKLMKKIIIIYEGEMLNYWDNIIDSKSKMCYY